MIIKLKIPSEIRFECPTCGKCFGSSKALGGHKRIHMEKKNKRDHETMELQGEEDGEKTLFPCPVCHKPFASKKSLHGHMRKHPDRGWRGMRPPPPPPEGEGSQPPDHETISLAHDLLALASGQPRDKGKSVMGESSLLANDDSGGDFHRDTSIIKSQKLFPCEVCGKFFRSYQALGGHKSHHGDQSPPHLYMEQPEGFERASAPGQLPENKGEEGTNGDQPGPRFLDFDLNELPKW